MTVLKLFLEAIIEYGCPSRVRGDRGGENMDLAIWMIMYRGANRASFMWGSYVLHLYSKLKGVVDIVLDLPIIHVLNVFGLRLAVISPVVGEDFSPDSEGYTTLIRATLSTCGYSTCCFLTRSNTTVTLFGTRGTSIQFQTKEKT